MHILEYSNYLIQPTQEALLIKPIRKLYNKDKTKNKEKFLQTMSLIYFYVDPRSTYNYITNDEERFQAILKQEGLPKNFTITKEIQEAIDEYKKHCITTSFLLL
jgi:spermidine/putrescine-binding protein